MTDVRKRGLMGKDAFYLGLGEMIAASIIARAQESRKAGAYQRAKEVVLTRPIGPNSKNYLILPEALIFGVPAEPLACYMFLRAAHRKSRWTARTVEKWMTWLRCNGLVREEKPRRGGKFSGTRYYPVLIDVDGIASWRPRDGVPSRSPPDTKGPDTAHFIGVSPDGRMPDSAPPDTYIGQVPSSHEERSHDPYTHGGSHLGGAEAGAIHDQEGGHDGFGADAPLGWLTKVEQTAPKRVKQWRAAMEYARDHAQFLDEAVVLRDLHRAARGKIGRALLLEEGLEDYRMLVATAAIVVEVEPDVIHRFAIYLVGEYFGDLDRWLNGWGWLGKALFGRLGKHVDLSHWASNESAGDDDDDEIPF